jgi:predicted dehydrogenase
MSQRTRRRFLEESLFAATAALAGGSASHALAEPATRRSSSPNEQIRVACIGVRGQGGGHVAAYASMKDAVVATICDADSGVVENRLNSVEAKTGKRPQYVQDLRQVMDDKSIDAVSIATPNHWHALAAIWAMQAGKDVYVEKPVSHNVSEGRRMVEAARKYGRICQTGTQVRSSTGVREAIQFLHDGKLGKIQLARALCYKSRGSIGLAGGEQKPPATLDYNLWTGPAPLKALTRKNLHYDWHWVWDTGNGDLGNQGIHQMDIARWGLGKDTLASNVLSLGGRFGYRDDGETPNTQLVFLDYGDSPLIFEVRGLKTDKLQGAGVGVIFYGSEGYLVNPSYTDAAAYDSKGNLIRNFSGGGNHFANFLDAVRSRKHTDLKADILEGHLSSALCHLGNVSYRLGTMQTFDADKKGFGDNKEAFETFARFEKHLADNGVRMEESQYRLGRQLVVDPRRETFPTDAEAAAMLTREYRKPFVVPEVV